MQGIGNIAGEVGDPLPDSFFQIKGGAIAIEPCGTGAGIPPAPDGHGSPVGLREAQGSRRDGRCRQLLPVSLGEVINGRFRARLGFARGGGGGRLSRPDEQLVARNGARGHDGDVRWGVGDQLPSRFGRVESDAAPDDRTGLALTPGHGPPWRQAPAEDDQFIIPNGCGLAVQPNERFWLRQPLPLVELGIVNGAIVLWPVAAVVERRPGTKPAPDVQLVPGSARQGAYPEIDRCVGDWLPTHGFNVERRPVWRALRETPDYEPFLEECGSDEVEIVGAAGNWRDRNGSPALR